MATAFPHARDEVRAHRALGELPRNWRPAPGHGAPSHRRYVAQLSSGRTVFLKVAAVDYVAGWLRTERETYEAFRNHVFLPDLLGWDDDGDHPLLAIEDLSGATWPPLCHRCWKPRPAHRSRARRRST
jgi:hypothetical protein